MLKYLLLALLARAPQHGYELKQAFEEMLGGTWLLNIGQVYTTLGRLEEDGLIEPTVVRQDLLPRVDAVGLDDGLLEVVEHDALHDPLCLPDGFSRQVSAARRTP